MSLSAERRGKCPRVREVVGSERRLSLVVACGRGAVSPLKIHKRVESRLVFATVRSSMSYSMTFKGSTGSVRRHTCDSARETPQRTSIKRGKS